MTVGQGRPVWRNMREPGALREFVPDDAQGAWSVAGFVAAGTRAGPTLAVLARRVPRVAAGDGLYLITQVVE